MATSVNGKPHELTPAELMTNAQARRAQLENDRLEILNNVLTMRQSWFRRFDDPRRSIEDECGFARMDEDWDAWQYYQWYDRDPLAGRVCEVFPKECFQVSPEVFERNDDEPTEFEEAWDNLSKSLRGDDSYFQDEEGSPVWEYLLRADILSGVGRYGIVLLGLGDDGKLEDEVRPRDGLQLEYLRVFPESLAPVASYDQNEKSKRFGQPTHYNITFNGTTSLQEPGRDVAASPNMITRRVHWSRVIHIADGLRANEVIGTSRIRPVQDVIQSARKIWAGSGEGYWKSVFTALSLETDPALGGNVQVDRGAVRDMLEEFRNGLQRDIFLNGATAKTLNLSALDPTQFLEAHINLICIRLGIPVRVFKGSERGELASSQDDAAWNDRLKQRQNGYVTPRIIIPLVDRLIRLRVLPEPQPQKPDTKLRPGQSSRKPDGSVVTKNFDGTTTTKKPNGTTVIEARGGYSVSWPDLTSHSDLEKADVAVKKTQALSAYVAGGVEGVMMPKDYLTRILLMSDEEAQAVIDNAAEHMEEKEAEDMLKQEELIEKGLAPDPIKEQDAKLEAMKNGVPAVPGGPPKPGLPPGAPPAGPKKPNPFAKNEEGDVTDNNCGTGEGGFKPGNTCQGGGGGSPVSSAAAKFKELGTRPHSSDEPIDKIVGEWRAATAGFSVKDLKSLATEAGFPSLAGESGKTIKAKLESNLKAMRIHRMRSDLIAENEDEGETTDNAGTKLTGGRWVTIRGSHIYIDKSGKAIVGNPKLVAEFNKGNGGGGGAEAKPAASTPTPKKRKEKASAPAPSKAEQSGPSSGGPSGGVSETVRFRKHKFAHQVGAADDLSGKESAALHERNWGESSKRLSDDHRDAVGTYATDAYVDINDGLRGKGRLSAEHRAVVAKVDAALDASRTKEPMTVYRGVKSLDRLGDPAQLVGKRFEDKAYTSTSTVGKVADGFAGKARFEIEVPKGSRALSVDSALGGERSLNQHEVVLPRGQRYEITGVEKKSITSLGKHLDDFFVIKARLVNDG